MLVKGCSDSGVKLEGDTVKVDQKILPFPDKWPIVPVRGKRPYQKGWLNRDYDRSEILAALQNGKATGVGLKLGNGLLAIDIDGESAIKLLSELAGENSLQAFDSTTAWTSGRPGRRQCLFSVSEADWPRLRNLRIDTGVIGDDGKEEGLEFRWLGNQSVLPPSLHPDTGKPYFWERSPLGFPHTEKSIQPYTPVIPEKPYFRERSPLDFPPLPAPEWLIQLCQNWHSEYVGPDEIDLVRFPVRLLPHFNRQMVPWLLARLFDISRQKYNGVSKGSGIGRFSLLAAAKISGRSQSHIRKLLRAAKVSGLIRNYKQQNGWITVWYSSIERAIAIAGLEQIGPIAAINIDELSNIHFVSTEVEAQALQRASTYKQRQEEIEQDDLTKGHHTVSSPGQIVKPTNPHTCDNPARVLGRGERFIYCDSKFRSYGGSQKAIAENRKISKSSVIRHLSNKYRLKPTPVRGYRQDVLPIVKKQVLLQLPELEGMPPKLCTQAGLFRIRGHWWEPRPNIYLLDRRLVSARRRRAQIKLSIDKANLLIEKADRGDLEDKAFLSSCDLKAAEKESKIQKPPTTNRKKETQK